MPVQMYMICELEGVPVSPLALTRVNPCKWCTLCSHVTPSLHHTTNIDPPSEATHKTMLRVCVAVLLCVSVDVTTAFLPATEETLVPGLQYYCPVITDISDDSGRLTAPSHTGAYDRCWHIECNRLVYINFLYLQLRYSYLDLYHSIDGVDYKFTVEYNEFSDIPEAEVVMNGSVMLHLRAGVAKATFDLDYWCKAPPTTEAPPTLVPPTPIPGMSFACQERTDLNNAAGKVTYANNTGSVVCWHIVCDTSVAITFTSFRLQDSALYLYNTSDGVDYSLDTILYNNDSTPEAIVLNGSAFLQLSNPSSHTSMFELDYVCLSPTPQPTTEAPPTLAPGVKYICEEYTDLTNTAGNVTYENNASAVCWHIECSTSVMITFTAARLQENVLYLYNTSDGVDYSLYTILYYTSFPVGPIVLNGSAFLQISSPYGGPASFELDYVCLSPTPQPATEAPPTLAPGVKYICEEYTDLTNTAGNVTYENNASAVCWHIECSTSVMITFTAARLQENVLYLYNTSDGVDYSLYTILYYTSFPVGPIVLNGSAFLQISSPYGGPASFELDYVCLSPTPQPATEAPPTLAPGVKYICEEYTDLTNTAGNVTYENNASAVCWHIECSTSVMITFTAARLQENVLYLYNTSDGVDYSLYTILYYTSFPVGPIVLNGSAFLQISSPYGGPASFELDYVCLSPTPQPTTESPPTLAPGVAHTCQNHTDLNETAGKVDFVSSMAIKVECWYIECDKSVMITFTTLSLENWAFLELFSSESENGTIHYTPERIISHSDSTGSGFVLNGPALVQFVQNYGLGENDASKVGFNYMCIGSPQPATEAPPTLAPGVEYVCQNHADLKDTSGKVSYVNHEANNTACWHIECDKSVAITFSYMQVYAQSFLYLYSSGSTSGSATHYTLEKVLFSPAASTGVEYLLDGSALMQFRSDTHAGRTELDFEYVCQSADKDDGGHSTWPYVVFPVVGVLSLALGVVALLKSGVFKAKVSKSSLKDGVNNNEGASVGMLEESPVM